MTESASGKSDLIIPCDCHGDHFLRISWWPGDADAGLEMDGWMSLGGDYEARFWRRVRAAWALLRHGHADTNVGVVLTGAKAAAAAEALLTFKRLEDASRAERDTASE